MADNKIRNNLEVSGEVRSVVGGETHVLSEKQNTLTAGTGISITDDVISVISGGVTVQELTPRNDITGITINKVDSSPSACRLIKYGKIAILNISIIITGTRSGPTGWYSLFPDFDFNCYYTPYLIKTNGASNLLSGHQYYFTNGQTYNETVNLQAVLIHV